MTPSDPEKTASTTGSNVRFLVVGQNNNFPIGVAELASSITA